MGCSCRKSAPQKVDSANRQRMKRDLGEGLMLSLDEFETACETLERCAQSAKASQPTAAYKLVEQSTLSRLFNSTGEQSTSSQQDKSLPTLEVTKAETSKTIEEQHAEHTAGMSEAMIFLNSAKDDDSFAVGKEMAFYKWIEALDRCLPAGLRVCVLGGTTFNCKDTEPFVRALSTECRARLGNEVTFVTGGMPGVQEAFAKGLGTDFQGEVRNLVPNGNASDFGVGTDVIAGLDLAERMRILSRIGHLYLTVEGGPGVAREAREAFANGAAILPIIWTGGASSGMFGFPPAALEQPMAVTGEQWSSIKRKTTAETAAVVVVDIISTLAQRLRTDPTNALVSFRPNCYFNLQSKLEAIMTSGELRASTARKLMAVLDAGAEDSDAESSAFLI